MWSLSTYLDDLDARYQGRLADVLSSSEGRRLATYDQPLLFAIIYLNEHLKTNGQVSMCQAHLDFCEHAKTWMQQQQQQQPLQPQANRHAYVCPRSLGKTSWWYLILPMWAAAHGHSKFIAAFADVADQAILHLATFRKELDSNDKIRLDYPALCTPAKKADRAQSVADRQYLYIAESGFIFSARGADTSVRGLKYQQLRPDTILLDDIEPDANSYNAKMVEERKSTIIDSIFPLEITARVVITGTTTMYGSIIHQLVRGDTWAKEQHIQVHHYLPIKTDSDGKQESLWPQKWALPWLLENYHFPWFRQEYLNDPLASGGIYWTSTMFRYGALDDKGVAVDTCIISVDPAVTSRDKSDYSAIAVVKYSRAANEFEIASTWHAKVTPDELRKAIERTIERFPEATAALVEVNQGQDLWKMALRGLPIKMIPITQTKISKTARAAKALQEYEMGRVLHAPGQTELEGELCNFPNGPNDDIVDAVTTGINEIRERTPQGRKRGNDKVLLSKGSYVM